MDEFEGRDLDRATEDAWRRFRGRLADRLAELGEGVLVVGAGLPLEDEDDGAAPYVQFAGFADGGMLRGEVSSNAYLAARHSLDERAEALLVDLGWSPPEESSENFFLDVPASHADRLAVMAVRALREVFGAAHPTFLDHDLGGPDDGSPEPPVDASGTADPLAVAPQDVDHLRSLVDAALTPLFGDLPEHDEDDDIPVPYGSSLVYVRVVEEAPVIDIFGVVVDGVTDRARASYEVNILNRDHRFVKFFLVEDRVVAQTLVAAWPFAAEHLRMMLTGMSAKLDQIGGELAVRVGGRTALSDDAEDGPAAPVTAVTTLVTDPETALRTLLQLDAGSLGVDAEIAATVCGFDQEVVLGALDDCLAQEAGWRESRQAALHRGDQREARACAREVAAWGRTTALLRQALRLLVERAAGLSPDPRVHGTDSPSAASRHRPDERRRARSRFTSEEQ